MDVHCNRSLSDTASKLESGPEQSLIFERFLPATEVLDNLTRPPSLCGRSSVRRFPLIIRVEMPYIGLTVTGRIVVVTLKAFVWACPHERNGISVLATFGPRASPGSSPRSGDEPGGNDRGRDAVLGR